MIKNKAILNTRSIKFFNGNNINNNAEDNRYFKDCSRQKRDVTLHYSMTQEIRIFWNICTIIFTGCMILNQKSWNAYKAEIKYKIVV